MVGQTRRPIVALNKKLHNEIGYSLRKYETAVGSKHGPVPLKTRWLLLSLHEDVFQQGSGMDWKVSCTVAREERPPMKSALVCPPPGLELVDACSSQDDFIEEEDEEEAALTTPRPGNLAQVLHETLCLSSEKLSKPAHSMEFMETFNSEDVCQDEQSLCSTPVQPADDGFDLPPDEEPMSNLVAPAKCPDSRAESEHVTKTDEIADGSAISEERIEKEVSAGISKGVDNQALHDNLSGQPSSEDSRALRIVRISLQGDAIAKKHKHSKLQELVASASNLLGSKGFTSVQDGIQIQSIHGEDQGGPAELTFPCVASALGFFLLFRDYEWESSNYQCLTVKLSNGELERQVKALDPTARVRFYNSSEVTPGNVMEHFPMSVPIQHESY